MTFSRTQPLRILLLDDQAIFLRGLKGILAQEPHLTVIGSFDTSRELFAFLPTSEADLLILDHALTPKDTNGLNFIKSLQQYVPELHILVVSAFYNSATVAQALRNGAKGFIDKNVSESEFLNAVQVVGSGNIYLEPLMALQLAQVHQPVIQAGNSQNDEDELRRPCQLSTLSPKVQDVMYCLLEGLTVTEIAEKFSRSIKTISGQKQAGMRKLGLKGDYELMKLKDTFQSTSSMGCSSEKMP